MPYIELEHKAKSKSWRHSPLISQMVADLADYLYARCQIQLGRYVFIDDNPNYLKVPITHANSDVDIVQVIKDSWICSGWVITIRKETTA